MLIIDALSLQIAWFAAALYHDLATPWLCLVVLVRVLLSDSRWGDIRPALAVMMAGLALELFMVLGGLSEYNSSFAMPLWLPLLWLVFGMTPGHSLNWLRQAPLPLQASLGALAGTLSYISADAFGVLNLQPETLVSAICLAILWSAALPVLLTLHTHMTTPALR